MNDTQRWYVLLSIFSLLDWLLVIAAYRWMPHWFYVTTIVVLVLSELGRAERWKRFHKAGTQE